MIPVLRLRGMISTFTHDDNNPLDQYLLLPDEQFETAAIPLTELRAKAVEQEARTTTDTFEYKEDNGVLTGYHLTILNDFVTYIRHTMEQFDVWPDIRIIVSGELLSLLFDGLPKDFIPNLVALHDSTLPSMFVLRTTKGPTKKCINFHVDGRQAAKTVQIPLNDPSNYKGGKLVFFVNDKVVAPPRATGSITRHYRDVLHGVTSVQRGLRNSFFIVDKPYGSNLEEQEGVITLKESSVLAYNSRTETKELKYTAVKDRMNRLEQDNTSMKVESEQLRKESNDLKAQVGTLENEIEDVKANLQKLTGATVDSLSMI